MRGAGSLSNRSTDGDDIFVTKRVPGLEQFLGGVFPIKDDLGQAVTVSDIDEDQS